MTGAKVNRDRLIVSAELPPRGERFEGVRPPMSRDPCFAIRKFAGRIFALEDYVSADVVTVHQAISLRVAVRSHASVVVAYGSASPSPTVATSKRAQRTA